MSTMAVPGRVSAIWGYNYEHNGKNISFTAGDVFTLIEKSNADWWLVSRDSGDRFFVPAKYLQEEIDNHIAPTQPRTTNPTPQNTTTTTNNNNNKDKNNNNNNININNTNINSFGPKLLPKPTSPITKPRIKHASSDTTAKLKAQRQQSPIPPIKPTIVSPPNSANSYTTNTFTSAAYDLNVPPTYSGYAASDKHATLEIVGELKNFRRSTLSSVPGKSINKGRHSTEKSDMMHQSVPSVAKTSLERPNEPSEIYSTISENKNLGFPESSSTLAPPPLPPMRVNTVSYKVLPEKAISLSPLHMENPIENSVRNESKHRNTMAVINRTRPASLMSQDTSEVFGETDLDGMNHIRYRGMTQYPSNPERECHSVSESDRNTVVTQSLSPGKSPSSNLPRNIPLNTLSTFYLQKRGQVYRKQNHRGPFGKQWEPQYLVLENFMLSFFKDSKVARMENCQPLLTLSLTHCEISLVPDINNMKKKNIFKILEQQDQGEEHYIYTEDLATLNEWFSTIQSALSQCNQSGRNRAKDVTPPEVYNTPISDKLDPNKQQIGERLLNLMRRRPTMEALQKKGIYKFNKFGSALTTIIDNEKTMIPEFLSQCIVAVEKRGLTETGIYRLNGNTSQIQKLRYLVDQDQCYNLDDLSQWEDINVITGALKLFLREMSEPLVPFECYNTFIETAYIKDQKAKVEHLKAMLTAFPQANRDFFKILCEHLELVIDNSDINKMRSSNLAIVFGPTLVIPELDSPALATTHFSIINQTLEFIFTNHRIIFA